MATLVQMLFLPKILLTGSLLQLKVFILFLGFGVSSCGIFISTGAVGGRGGGGPPRPARSGIVNQKGSSYTCNAK